MRPRQYLRGFLRAPFAAGVVALLAIGACSKDKSVDQPAKLTPLAAPTLRVQRLWSATVDDKKAVVLRLGLGVSVAGNRVYAAGHHGDVLALDVGSGRVLWRAKTRAPLSGGTAAGADLVLVGASDGQFFAFNAANGESRWKVRLNGEILAPAAISERLIAVRTVDGKLHGLSPADGHELWSQEQQVPRLSLRGTARPVITGDVVLCGFDNGKVLAVNAGDGSVQWEATVTPPHGRTELERLADIDSAVSVAGQNVYAVGFQGRVAMLALDTGQVWWSHEASSYRGLTLDGDTLYVATADSEVVALQARTGAELWRQKALLNRGISALAVMDDALVTADYQGYVHWLTKSDGALAARVATGKARISNPPVVAGNVVVVVNDRGQIHAFRATPLAAPPANSRKGARKDARVSAPGK
ncbi:MAG: outer membrane protein assembly factor BamB [Gammaproteobacteria bacterium]|nr:outer membrane protein assembly factor BamB [Gammaproteobacteria bacterium]